MQKLFVILVLFFISNTCSCSEIIYLDIPPGESNFVRLEVNQQFPILDGFEICLQFNLKNSLDQIIIFIDKENGHELFMRADDGIGFLTLNNRDYVFKVHTSDFKLFSWMHFCFSINDTTYRVVVDGKLWFEESHLIAKEDFKPIHFGVLEFGKKLVYIPIGVKVSNFNIWQKAYSLEEIINYTKLCQEPSIAPKLDWSTLKTEDFSEVGFKNQVKVGSRHEICGNLISPKTLGFQKKLDLFKAAELCDVFGARLVRSPRNVSDRLTEKCDLVLTPLYKTSSNRFIDYTTKEEISDWQQLPWKTNEPNGKMLERCVVSNEKILGRNMVDYFCTIGACFNCLFETVQTFFMKGLEPKSPMDNLYTLDIDQLFGGMPTFKGVFHGYILFDEPNSRWIAVKGKQLPKSNEDIDANILAYFDLPTDFTSPVGVHKWTMMNTTSQLKSLKLSKVSLYFS